MTLYPISVFMMKVWKFNKKKIHCYRWTISKYFWKGWKEEESGNTSRGTPSFWILWIKKGGKMNRHCKRKWHFRIIWVSENDTFLSFQKIDTFPEKSSFIWDEIDRIKLIDLEMFLYFGYQSIIDKSNLLSINYW